MIIQRQSKRLSNNNYNRPTNSHRIIINMLSSINLTPLKKQKRLKELSLSDVMVALIHQESTTDQTMKLKEYLYKIRLVDEQANEEGQQVYGEQMLILPEFASTEFPSQDSLLLHHLNAQYQNNRANPRIWEILSNYESLLESVENKLHTRLSLLNKSQKFIETTLLLEALSEQLKTTYTKLAASKHKSKALLQVYHTSYAILVVKHRKRQNIIKILDNINIWGEFQIAKLLRFNIENPQKIVFSSEKDSNIIEMFDRCIEMMEKQQKERQNQHNQRSSTKAIKMQELNEEQGLLQRKEMILKEPFSPKKRNSVSVNRQKASNIKHMIVVLEERRKVLIAKIHEKYQNSIVEYKSNEQYLYWYKLDQSVRNYLKIENDQSDRKEPETQKMHQETKFVKSIEKNVSFIFFQVLQTFTYSNHIELLNQSQYVNFFKELLNRYIDYIKNWHKVTTIHLQENLPHQHSYLKNRGSVLNKLQEKIAYTIKSSNKFLSFSIQTKLYICTLIYDFIGIGQEWMGKSSKFLQEVLIQKMNSQTQINYKSVNSELKMSLSEEIFGENDRNKQKHQNIADLFISQLKQVLQKIQSKQSQEIIQKVYVLLSSSQRSQSKQLQKQSKQLQKQSKQQDINTSDVLINSLSHKQQERNHLFDQLSVFCVQNISFTTQLSDKLLKILVEYAYKQLYIPNQCFLLKFYDHFEYMIIILYKMALDDCTRKLVQDRMEGKQNEWRQKLKRVQVNSWTKGIDDQNLWCVGELTDLFICKKEEGNMLQFLVRVNQKYQSLHKISSMSNALNGINMTKCYADFERYEDILKNINLKVIKVIEELTALLTIINKTYQHFITIQTTNPNHSMLPKLHQIQQVLQSFHIFPLVLQELLIILLNNYYTHANKKYYKDVTPIFITLKWDVKKLNQEARMESKEYKQKILDVYRANSLTLHLNIKNNTLSKLILQKQCHFFYKYLLELYYTKIQKINDNGRQILRLDYIELSKIIGESSFMDQYLEMSIERNSKMILEKIQNAGFWLSYPIHCWKSLLMWTYNDFSSKEKKQFVAKLYSVYVAGIKSLPEI